LTEIPEDSAELISAYVDGELSLDFRAEVQARAARDPAFARELAAVTRLKAALGHAVPVPEIKTAARRPRRARRRVLAGVAAALVLTVATGLGLWFSGADAVNPVAARLDWAVALHRDWAGIKLPPNGPAAAVPASLPIAPHVPDLSANGLELAHVATGRTPEGAPALILGYLGTRGCRVTMIATRVPEVADEPILVVRAGLRARFWQVGQSGYLLLAEGMSPSRFRLVSGSLLRATRNRAPFGAETRQALRRNRAESPPCLA
jgi:anti-sigma factor RsiW